MKDFSWTRRILPNMEGYSWTWRHTPGHRHLIQAFLLNLLLHPLSSVSAMASTPAPKRRRVHRFPQHEICAALRRMFDGWDIKGRIPHLESILECDTFSAYTEEVAPGVSTSADNHLPPCNTGREQRGQVEAALGLQVGAMHSKHSLGPLAAQGDGPEAHLASARRLASLGDLPASSQLPADEDLRFAASWATADLSRLRIRRDAALRAFESLAWKCKPLSEYLRSFQDPSVAAVAGQINVALIAVLVYVLRWPDTTLPRRFIEGFQVLGAMEVTGVFKPSDFGPIVEKNQLFSDHPTNLRRWNNGRRDENAAFLMQCCHDDHSKGFASGLLSHEQLNERFGAGRWCSNPRFSIVQGTGKIRPIDNGKASGASAATSYGEKLVLCTFLFMAISARLIVELATTRGIDLASHALEAGGEDLPDAYRHMPAAPANHDVDIVAVRSPGAHSTSRLFPASSSDTCKLS